MEAPIPLRFASPIEGKAYANMIFLFEFRNFNAPIVVYIICSELLFFYYPLKCEIPSDCL